MLNGGNHTRDFASAAATPAAHQACLDVSKALAATGIRVLIDDAYFAEVSIVTCNDFVANFDQLVIQVKKTFEESQQL